MAFNLSTLNHKLPPAVSALLRLSMPFLERFRRSSLPKGCSGFAEKWHGHLARDYWTSSAGCRCHAETPRKDLYRKRSRISRMFRPADKPSAMVIGPNPALARGVRPPGGPDPSRHFPTRHRLAPAPNSRRPSLPLLPPFVAAATKGCKDFAVPVRARVDRWGGAGIGWVRLLFAALGEPGQLAARLSEFLEAPVPDALAKVAAGPDFAGKQRIG